jgi:hypothetical protein
MSNYVYYYGEEAIVFADLSEARNYFYDEDILRRYDDDYAFKNFLNESYTLVELFEMKDDEKADVVSDYEDDLFEYWVDEELVKCELYGGRIKV